MKVENLIQKIYLTSREEFIEFYNKELPIFLKEASPNDIGVVLENVYQRLNAIFKSQDKDKLEFFIRQLKYEEIEILLLDRIDFMLKKLIYSKIPTSEDLYISIKDILIFVNSYLKTSHKFIQNIIELNVYITKRLKKRTIESLKFYIWSVDKLEKNFKNKLNFIFSKKHEGFKNILPLYFYSLVNIIEYGYSVNIDLNILTPLKKEREDFLETIEYSPFLIALNADKINKLLFSYLLFFRKANIKNEIIKKNFQYFLFEIFSIKNKMNLKNYNNDYFTLLQYNLLEEKRKKFETKYNNILKEYINFNSKPNYFFLDCFFFEKIQGVEDLSELIKDKIHSKDLDYSLNTITAYIIVNLCEKNNFQKLQEKLNYLIFYIKTYNLSKINETFNSIKEEFFINEGVMYYLLLKQGGIVTEDIISDKLKTFALQNKKLAIEVLKNIKNKNLTENKKLIQAISQIEDEDIKKELIKLGEKNDNDCIIYQE